MLRLPMLMAVAALALAAQETAGSLTQLERALAAGDNRQVNALTSRAMTEKADLQTLLAIGGLLGE